MPGDSSADILETAYQVDALGVVILAIGGDLNAADFDAWRASLQVALAPSYRWVEGLRQTDDGLNPNGSYRYQGDANARVTANTTAAGILVDTAAYPNDWKPSLAAFEELRDRVDRGAEPWSSHFLTWDAELLAGRAIGGPGACCRLGHEHDAVYEAFRADQRAWVLERATKSGRWTCTVGPGDAYVTAVACILLSGTD